MRYSVPQKLISFIVTFALVCSLAAAPLIGWANEGDGETASVHEQNLATQIETSVDTSTTSLDAAANNKPIAIIHTNDVHCNINESSTSLGYAGLATQVKDAQALYGIDNVALVDAGDSVQGKPVGTLSKGEDITDIMNESGYSVATLGNHEFDYGMTQLNKLTSKANFPYVSCNFISLATGKPVYDPYVIRTYGNTQIAFVGISTPESLTKSSPVNFQDENGNGRILVKNGPDPVPTPSPTPTPVPISDPTTTDASTLARTGDSNSQFLIVASSLALSGLAGLVVSSSLLRRSCSRGAVGVSRARIRRRNDR